MRSEKSEARGLASGLWSEVRIFQLGKFWMMCNQGRRRAAAASGAVYVDTWE